MREYLQEELNAWSFLASVFNELPDAALVQNLREQADSSWMDGLSDDEAVTRLGVDRAKLMRYVDNSCINPPYESMYTGGKEDLILSDLHGFFLEARFAPTGEYHDPVDYLGLQFSFLAECCARQRKALDKGFQEEASRLESLRDQFITQHMNVWVPAYAQAMLGAAQTEFYAQVARMLLDIFQPEA